MNTDANCATCRSWNERERRAYGECRRRPPVVIIEGKGSGPRTLFPMVEGRMWCGEHSLAHSACAREAAAV